nr:L-histidine N(alpha)-methyltransferase [Pontibacter qinzhouensis]
MKPGDLVLLGFDLKKHPETIWEAYNDRAGITGRFNLNLLKRINRELYGDFELDAFEHYLYLRPW